MTHIFDGKAFAWEKENKLKEEMNSTFGRKRLGGVTPRLVSILVGDNPASTLYVNLKRKVAERIGAKVEVISLSLSISKKEIQKIIVKFNNDDNVHGIMVQLPLPDNFSKGDRDEILNTIAKEKDVDGLREDSLHLTPTVKAVLEILRIGKPYIKNRVRPCKVVVVGAMGFEGKKIYQNLKKMGYEVEGLDRKSGNLKKKTKMADILISVTGSPGVIGRDDIKKGAVVIDVGAPYGDIEKGAYEKASFVSPVPGGVGPVTISCLLENLVEAAKN
ncbi:MAG: Bifunctional protein FolD [Candidatus Woesebacteria bacterium GW2011_GWB1_39_12]|uniref:Bifunctional protein FolD n=2 Tax=Candidatus Woeseibacteriota TaxID=1752722 RepID=A0A0G0ME75_9BACT|nr:MAG: Bifunctional protein FolD [Candidatus Woesebacteria bacterium GW2011_GWA1_39_12]KKR00784.1 MAG: Bifunctional protein FolD [Candidatus Woesebacteria bacterium GW2011_GWB1_39_12]